MIRRRLERAAGQSRRAELAIRFFGIVAFKNIPFSLKVLTPSLARQATKGKE
jgi:hypothetical protein